MNTQELLEKLLSASKNIVEQGKELAEDKLNIPDDGPEREEKLNTLKKGAAVAAVVTALLGTKSGRKLTGTAIKVGSLAAIGGVAYKAYKNWQSNASGTPVNELEHKDAEERSLLLLQAMVAAANADGHIDKEEQALIKQEILNMHLPDELFDTVEDIIETPLSIEDIAALTKDDATASEIYLATRLFIGNDSAEIEKNYLQALTSALNLAPELVEKLDQGIDSEAIA